LLTGNSLFEAELKKRVGEEIASLTEMVVNPQVTKSYENYQFLAGQIFALKRVFDIYCDEVQTEINKRT
jgi:hypothetical protein